MRFSLQIGKLRIGKLRKDVAEEPKYISETKPVQPHKPVERAMELEDSPQKITVEVIDSFAIVDVVVKDKH